MSDSSTIESAPEVRKKRINVALLGNPNSGKTSIYNHLTGLNQRTGNFPGVTVDKKSGITNLGTGLTAEIFDLPGTYSLYPRSEDQKVVLQSLLNADDKNYPDLVLFVADTSNLERNLLLLTQLMDLQIPVILCLNMIEVAEKGGTSCDEELLAKELGVPVCKVNGRTGKGLSTLKQTIVDHLLDLPTSFINSKELSPEIIAEIRSLLDISNDYRALVVAHNYKILDHLNDEQKALVQSLTEKHQFKSIRVEVPETLKRYEKLKPIVKRVLTKEEGDSKLSFTEKLDQVLTHKFFGTLIFIGVLFLTFQAIFAWASFPMDLMDSGMSKAISFLESSLPDNVFSRLLTGGVLPGIAGILIFIPQIAILFTLVAILEESGYMARAVYLSDRLMQKFGMNGRSLVALISGAACAVPAVMSARTISNSKERLITIFVTPFITCSARIPVFVVLIAFAVPSTYYFGFLNLQGLVMMGLYFVGALAALLSAYVMKKIMKSEDMSFLMMELPGYKTPHWKNVFITVLEKVKIFVIEAGRVILAISIVLWILSSSGPGDALNNAERNVLSDPKSVELSKADLNDKIAAQKLEASYAGEIGKFIEPVIRPLGFDWKIGIALVTSFAAREVFVGTMATIYSVGSSDDEQTIIGRMREARHAVSGKLVYTPATAFSLLIFYALAMQCMSTLAIVYRESKSLLIPMAQLVYMTGLAYVASWIIFTLMR